MEEQDPREKKSNGNFYPKAGGRAAVLLGIAVLLFSALLLRVFYLQTFKHAYYKEKVLMQVTTESSVRAERGDIRDAGGHILATNITTYRVFISPSTIRNVQARLEKEGTDVELATLIAENLAAILDVDYEYALKQTTYTKYLDRTIQRQVSKDNAERVRAFIAEYEDYGLARMIYLEPTYTRHYPYSDLASHTIGFAGSDGHGLYGLEYYYNEMLAGSDGRYVTARDSQGNEMPYNYKEYIEAQNGYDVNTTIDINVQLALEEQLSTAYLESGGQNRAAGIVMDVKTGAILGMAVYPDFDLNAPRELDAQSAYLLASSGIPVDSDDYLSLKQELQVRMWGNKAITESYIPGSTFKVITAAMAVEEDVDAMHSSHTCTGSYTVLGHKIKCHKVHGHGTLTFEQGIQQSCNPWLMRLGLGLGKSNFYSYLKAFGYLNKTGIDLPGEGGSLFATEEAFTDLDLAIYAFGQNFNVTLIQQITAVSAVANGGYIVQPHTVSSVTDEKGNVIFSFDASARRQVVSEATCKRVAQILEEGVSGDGGAKNAYVAGYRVAAKTGTSEKKERECPKCDSAGLPQKINGREIYVCSLCKYAGEKEEFKVSEDYVCSTVAFAPADDPKYAVIIIVDEPTKGTLYGSTVAAPYVGNVMETILPYLGVEAKYSDAELAKMTVKAPSVLGYTVSAARKYYPNVTFEVVGDPSGIICRQYPEAGTVMEKDHACVLIYTDSTAPIEMTRVPDLTGMTARAANEALANAGLNIRILGTAEHLSGTGPKAYLQSVAAGTEVARGMVIEVYFRTEDGVEDFDEAWSPDE